MTDEEIVPWEDLSDARKRRFASMVRDAGLDVSREEAERYYGNKERLKADLREERDYPGHDTDYGEISPGIRMYGVGEFDPESPAAGTPVFEAKTDAGSFLTFAWVPDEVEEADLRVFHAHSEERGEFRRLMDTVIQHFSGAEVEPKEVVYANVVTRWLSGRDLDDVLDGFERRTVEAEAGPWEGDDYDELVGTWDPRRSDA